MEKSADAFRTISEVAEILETPAHVLRFWESRFPQIRPVKRAGGRRYYRPADVALLSGIRKLLHDDGMTIRGVQKILREQGIRHVAALGGADPGPEAAEEAAAMDDLPEMPLLEPEAPAGEVVPFEPRSFRGSEAEPGASPAPAGPDAEAEAAAQGPDAIEPRGAVPAPAAPFTPPPPLPAPAWADLAAELAGGFGPAPGAPEQAAAPTAEAQGGADGAEAADATPPAAPRGFTGLDRARPDWPEAPQGVPGPNQSADAEPEALADLAAGTLPQATGAEAADADADWRPAPGDGAARDLNRPHAPAEAPLPAAEAASDLPWPPAVRDETNGWISNLAHRPAPDAAAEDAAPGPTLGPAPEAGTGEQPALPDQAGADDSDAGTPAPDATAPAEVEETDAPVVWMPSLLRALPPGALSDRRAEVEALRERLLALRARLTDAARG